MGKNNRNSNKTSKETEVLNEETVETPVDDVEQVEEVPEEEVKTEDTEETVETPAEDEETPAEPKIEAPKKTITNVKVIGCRNLRIRKTPNANSTTNIIKTVPAGTILNIEESANGWSKLANNKGYVMTKYVAAI